MVCYVTIYILVFGTGAEELQRLRDEATSDAEEKNEDPPSFNCGSLYFKFIIKVKVAYFTFLSSSLIDTSVNYFRD